VTLLRQTVSMFPFYRMCARQTMRTDALTLADSSFLSGRRREIYSTHPLLLTPVLTVRFGNRSVSIWQHSHTDIEHLLKTKRNTGGIAFQLRWLAVSKDLRIF
jgi:hypothetical protein